MLGPVKGCHWQNANRVNAVGGEVNPKTLTHVQSLLLFSLSSETDFQSK